MAKTMYPEAVRILGLGSFRSAIGREPTDTNTKKRRFVQTGLPSDMRRLRQRQDTSEAKDERGSAGLTAVERADAKPRANGEQSDPDTIMLMRVRMDRLEHHNRALQETNTVLQRRLAEYEDLCGMLV